MEVRAFLKANGLKQRELAHYLDVTEAAISNVVKGKSDFAEENLIKILNNPHGWDVSMLTETQDRDDVRENTVEPSDRVMIDRLWFLIDELRKDNQTLLGMVKEKDREIKALRDELDARKRGAAQNAEVSLSADAV